MSGGHRSFYLIFIEVVGKLTKDLDCVGTHESLLLLGDESGGSYERFKMKNNGWYKTRKTNAEKTSCSSQKNENGKTKNESAREAVKSREVLS